MINRHQTQPVRTGAIVSFTSIGALSKGFNHVASMLPAFDSREFCERYGPDSQPPNVINIALQIFKEEDDMPQSTWTTRLIAFVNDHKDRVSILICRPSQYPVYYTLREFDGTWGEEQAIRNIELALAFQLELSRLSNYNLRPCFVEAKQIHVYHAVGIAIWLGGKRVISQVRDTRRVDTPFLAHSLRLRGTDAVRYSRPLRRHISNSDRHHSPQCCCQGKSTR
jgi:Acetyl-CoA carboxylase, central region